MKIALGTAQFGTDYGISNLNGQSSIDDVKKIIEFSRKIGIKKIDTAKNYGETEKIIGEVGIKDFEIITKLPKISSKESNLKLLIDNQIQDSISKMKISKIDTLLLHNSKDLLSENGNKIFDIIQELKKEGIINKFGISIYEKDEIDQLNKNFKFDVIQIPFNIFDTRLIKSGFLRGLKKKGIEIHARSIFLQGLLINNHNLFPRKLKKFSKYFITWKKFCIKNNVSLKEACIIFATKQKFVSKFVLGFKNSKELEQILKINLKKKINFNKNFLNIPNKLKNPNLW